MKISAPLLSLPLALTLSASCLAKNEITIGDLTSNPKAYEGKEIALRCIVRSADPASAYCEQNNQSVSLSAKTMDKSSLKFALANCAKPKESENDPRCRDVLVTAKLKSAANPRWLDNVKLKFASK